MTIEILEVLPYDKFNSLHVYTNEAPPSTGHYILEPDTGGTGMDVKIQDAAAEFWTVEIKQAYQEYLAGAQGRKNAAPLSYLAKTDWYAIRFAETGELVPAEISTARQTAREAIV